MGHSPKRQQAERQFWIDVEEILKSDYRYSPGIAASGIQLYQQEIRVHRLGDVVFNQGEEQTARVIDGLLRNGVPSTN